MAMQGNLRDMSVADLIQINCQDKKTARARIQSGGKEARVFFQNGTVIHAESGELIGEEVIYAILKWDQGDFIIENDIVPPMITIKRSWSGLLLEGAKRLDESHADQALEIFPAEAPSDKDALVKGLLSSYMEKFPAMDSIGISGIDGYIKYGVHRNLIDASITGAITAALYNQGKRSLGLMRMDTFQKNLLGGEKNAFLVCQINRYSLLYAVFSEPAQKISLDWFSLDELLVDLATLL